MRHCCEFRPDDVYYLDESVLYQSSKLSIGFCPVCGKPVAELVRINFNGCYERVARSGINANTLVSEIKDKIIYSARDVNYLKFKSKPYGWRYGINKSTKINGSEHVKQYACDFYGNKELIKTV